MRARVALALLPLLVLAGCAGAPAADDAPAPSASAGALEGSLTVFAAASLTDTFDALVAEFEREHPAVDVTVQYGGSSGLATQIVEGAPVDVFAAASAATMETVVEAGDAAGDPVVFATNILEIAVPPGNPGGVTGLGDLADQSRVIVLCDVAVPCGAAAERVLAAAGIAAAPDSLEQDVKAVVTKVSLGEADAGLVYVTDVRAAGGAVEGIAFDGAEAAVTDYPIVRTASAADPALADAFIALVTGERGRAVLDSAGFGAVEPGAAG